MSPAAGRVATGFGNRELSWLAFDERVLEEAADPSTPLLERVKFAAIAASNLDEFFMVRVAGLQQEVADGTSTPDPASLSPARQLDAISERAHALSGALYTLTRTTLLPSLAAAGLRVAGWDAIDQGPRSALSAFFANELLPVLTPFAIDVSRPFPLLASLSLYVAVRLAPAPGDDQPRLAIVPVPAGQTRLVPLAAGAPMDVRAARRDHSRPPVAVVPGTADPRVRRAPRGARRRTRSRR